MRDTDTSTFETSRRQFGLEENSQSVDPDESRGEGSLWAEEEHRGGPVNLALTSRNQALDEIFPGAEIDQQSTAPDHLCPTI